MDSEKVKEIKKALDCCTNIYDCKFCPYRNVSSDCQENLIYNMGVYINELENENAEQLKQFAERLKEKLFDLGNIVNEEDIDETLKEFLK